MALHLIIDGYNLIRTSPSLSRPSAQDLDMGREALLTRLASYRRIKHKPITVVFDAAYGSPLSRKNDVFQGIKVVYSPAGTSADRVISRMAGEMGSQALVVTSDRALSAAVERAGATAIPSQEFEDRMEMAFYMDFKGDLSEDEDGSPDRNSARQTTRKKGPSRRLPKSERRRRAKLKKV
jgi:predicted RNA-binding protein with PIN domain